MGWAKALYIDSLYAYAARDAHAQEEQERRKAGMAVNSGSLMLKRCRQAQKMHGINSQNASPNQPGRLRKKVQPIVPNRFSGGASSSGLGSSTDGNNATFGEGQ